MKRLHVMTFRTAADAQAVLIASRRAQQKPIWFFRLGRWVWWLE